MKSGKTDQEDDPMKDFIDLTEEQPIKVRVFVRIPVKKYPRVCTDKMTAALAWNAFITVI